MIRDQSSFIKARYLAVQGDFKTILNDMQESYHFEFDFA